MLFHNLKSSVLIYNLENYKNKLNERVCPKLLPCTISIVSPSSSLRSPGKSTDSASDAREVRLDEAPEAKLAGLLPGNRLTQWSHRDELVEPA